jgi:hypothetical protein
MQELNNKKQLDTIETIELIINDIEYVIKNNINVTKLDNIEKEFLFNKLNELLMKIDIINWIFIDKLDDRINTGKHNKMGICSYKIIVDMDGYNLYKNNEDMFSMWNNGGNKSNGDKGGNDGKGDEEEPFIIELVGKVMPESYILSCNYLFSQKDFINGFIKSIKHIVDLRNDIKKNINNN